MNFFKLLVKTTFFLSVHGVLIFFEVRVYGSFFIFFGGGGGGVHSSLFLLMGGQTRNKLHPFFSVGE